MHERGRRPRLGMEEDAQRVTHRCRACAPLAHRVWWPSDPRAEITPLFLRRTGVPSIAQRLRRDGQSRFLRPFLVRRPPFCAPGLDKPALGLDP